MVYPSQRRQMSFEAYGHQPEPPLNLPDFCPACADGNCLECEPEFEAQGWICDCECAGHCDECGQILDSCECARFLDVSAHYAQGLM